MYRRSKIIATLGPASSSKKVLEKMLAAGVNLVRINMSHGSWEEHAARVDLVRKISAASGKIIGILIDLQGPKIRIAKFKKNKIELKIGQTFTLDAGLDSNSGDQQVVGIDYKQLPKDVSSGDTLLLDDGRIVLEIQQVNADKIITIVKLGGVLSNNKGINKQGGGLSANAITEKDLQDLDFIATIQPDFVALSFPRSAQDLQKLKALLQEKQINASIVAKIERVEAVANLEEIILASNAVMIARGDLGVEVGFAELPAIQKQIIHTARRLQRAVITATQMMESMISNPLPTRAEVADVANAVLDGSDAVMLSAETATGNYPVRTIEAMSQVCMAAERQRASQVSHHRLNDSFNRVDESIAMAAMYVANHLKVSAIVALTETGSTPLWMSRIRSGIPIYGISRNLIACGKMTLYRGVYPIEFDVTNYKRWEVIQYILDALLAQNIVTKGDKIIVTRGDITGISGSANELKIVTVN